jgi:hypothetical protein
MAMESAARSVSGTTVGFSRLPQLVTVSSRIINM